MTASANALQYFHDALENDAGRLQLFEFSEKHIHTKEGKVSFTEHPEQLQLYKDMSPRMVILKGVQQGASLHEIARGFWVCDDRMATVMYLLPTRNFVNEFVADRVDTIISSSPYLRDRMRDVDNRYVKKFGFSSLYFHGCESDRDVVSVPVDFLICDEYDIMNQENVKVAEDRLEHSNLAWHHILSKPSVPGFGIDEKFKTSDQHYRLFRCPKCRHDTNIIFYMQSDFEAAVRCKEKKSGTVYYFACEKCGAALDPANAHWVALNPGSDIRGYHLSQAYWVRKPAHYSNVAEKFLKTYQGIKNIEDKKYLWRSLVGVAFGGDEQPLTDEIFNAQAQDIPLSPGWPGLCFAGIDNSDKKHVAIAHQEGFKLVFHWFEETDSIEEVFKFFKLHNIKKAIIDAMPNKDSAKKLAKRFKGRVLIQYFKDRQKESDELAGLETIPVYEVNRTDSLDDLIDAIKSGQVVIPSRKAGIVIDIVRKHLMKLIKEKETNAAGQEVKRYKGKVENHFAMAMNSAYQAWTLFQLNMPTVISTTPVGGHISVEGSKYDTTN